MDDGDDMIRLMIMMRMMRMMMMMVRMVSMIRMMMVTMMMIMARTTKGSTVRFPPPPSSSLPIELYTITFTNLMSTKIVLVFTE